MRGEEPVESIRLLNKDLTVLSAIIIASLLPSNKVTKSLEYVAARPFPKCQHSASAPRVSTPHDTPLSALFAASATTHS